MNARSALLGYAVTLGLLELWTGSGGFVWSLGLVCLLVGWIPAFPRDAKRSPGLTALRPGAYALASALIAWVGLHGALSIEAPPALVTVVRVLALGGLLLVPLTPAPASPLHALGLIMCAWCLATLEPTPSVVALGLGLLVLAGALDGLRRTPSRRSSVTLAVLLLGLLPWLGGAQLPRWPLAGAASVGPAGPSGEPLDDDPSAPQESGVDPDRVWSTGGAARRSMRLVATVAAPKLRGDLLLRAVALEEVGPEGFSVASTRREQPTCLQPITVEAEVELAEPVSGFLPCVGIPLGATVAHAIDDAGLQLRGPASYPLRYSVAGQVVHPRFLLVGREVLQRPDLLQLPLGLPPELRGLAREAVGSRESPWARALNAARWLQQRARYADTEFADGALYPRCLSFLTQTRSGVCTEFASALVVFLRAEGIPCRLVLGYRSDEREPDGTFLVRAKHAHAWVELPLDDAGWVALDPTPGGALPLPVLAPEPAATPATPAGRPGASLGAILDSHGRPLLATLVALGLLGVLVTGLRRQRGDRRRGWSAQLGAAGETPELPERERWLLELKRAGYRVGGAETPAGYLRRVANAELLRGNALYERARFGAPSSAAIAEFRRWLDEAAARPAPDRA
ncbi:MAG: transglutaminase domain-containing protein [Planctomycetes bacterium]|nr:transglutaminase domain-containing protein [Planctomycetota bacterium]